MDQIRSCGLSRVRLFRDSEETTLIRWFPAAPGAKVFPDFHAFGYPRFEEFPDEFDGAGVFAEGQVWRGNTYPAPPGLHFHGELEWFKTGVPRSVITGELGTERCGAALINCDGGIEVGGSSGIALPSITTCTVCTHGAFPTYIVRVRGVQDGTKPASDINGDHPVNYVSACTWQGPSVPITGFPLVYFWQLVFGGVTTRVQLRRLSGTPSNLTIWDTPTPPCYLNFNEAFTSGIGTWDWSQATMEVIPTV